MGILDLLLGTNPGLLGSLIGGSNSGQQTAPIGIPPGASPQTPGGVPSLPGNMIPYGQSGLLGNGLIGNVARGALYGLGAAGQPGPKGFFAGVGRGAQSSIGTNMARGQFGLQQALGQQEYQQRDIQNQMLNARFGLFNQALQRRLSGQPMSGGPLDSSNPLAAQNGGQTAQIGTSDTDPNGNQGQGQGGNDGMAEYRYYKGLAQQAYEDASLGLPGASNELGKHFDDLAAQSLGYQSEAARVKAQAELGVKGIDVSRPGAIHLRYDPSGGPPVPDYQAPVKEDYYDPSIKGMRTRWVTPAMPNAAGPAPGPSAAPPPPRRSAGAPPPPPASSDGTGLTQDDFPQPQTGAARDAALSGGDPQIAPPLGEQKSVEGSVDSLIKINDELQNQALEAPKVKRQINELRGALNGLQTGPGPVSTEDMNAAAAAIKKTTGFDINSVLPPGLQTDPVKENIAAKNIQELAMIIGRASFPVRVTDSDLNAAIRATPNFFNVPGANKQLLDNLEQVQNLRVRQAQFFRNYMKLNNGRLDWGVIDAWDRYVANAKDVPQNIKDAYNDSWNQPNAMSGTSDNAIIAIPQQAKDYLKKNPGTRAQFDQWYGAGEAAKVLGK